MKEEKFSRAINIFLSFFLFLFVFRRHSFLRHPQAFVYSYEKQNSHRYLFLFTRTKIPSTTRELRDVFFPPEKKSYISFPTEKAYCFRFWITTKGRDEQDNEIKHTERMNMGRKGGRGWVYTPGGWKVIFRPLSLFSPTFLASPPLTPSPPFHSWQYNRILTNRNLISFGDGNILGIFPPRRKNIYIIYILYISGNSIKTLNDVFRLSIVFFKKKKAIDWWIHPLISMDSLIL